MSDIHKTCVICGKTFYRSSDIAYSKWERRRFCSRGCSDKGRDSSHLVKYQVKKGQHISVSTELKSEKVTGSLNINWKGESASYAAIHIWVKYHYGSPNICDHCGTTEKRMYHWANISRKYKRERSDWLRLCVPCHKRFDLKFKE